VQCVFPSTDGKPGLCQFKDYLRDPSAVTFFRDVKDFQRMAVRDWNPNCDEVTLSFNMGFVGVREDSSDGAASVILVCYSNSVYWYTMMMKPGHCTSSRRFVGYTVLAIVRQLRIAQHLSTS